MPRKVKLRAAKVSRFPLRPLWFLLQFLNGKPVDQPAPYYAVSLDGLPTVRLWKKLPAFEYPTMKPKRRQHMPVRDPVPAFKTAHQVSKVRKTLKEVASLMPVYTRMDPAAADRRHIQFENLLAGWTQRVLDYGRPLSPRRPRGENGRPRFEIAVADRASAAIILMARLWSLGEGWRLKRCTSCEAFFLKRIARHSEKEYCSNSCRYEYHNAEKKKARDQGKISEELDEPVERLPLRRSSGGRRHLTCPSYETCLVETKAKGWQDFTCEECGASPF